jgi:hypothetical protein
VDQFALATHGALVGIALVDLFQLARVVKVLTEIRDELRKRV